MPMDIITFLINNPVNSLTLAAIIVVIVFQMAQAGILNIKIGKNGDSKRHTHDYQGQIDDIREDVNTLKEDVKVIRDNHLAHIQDDISRVKEDVSYIKGKLSK